MSTFDKVLENASNVPERHVVLPVSAFADDWNPKPQGEVALGLRRFSEADIFTARAEASRFAVEMNRTGDLEGQLETYNDSLMCWLVVRGTCDANDKRLNAPIFDGSEQNVRNALTAQGLRFVWDHVERYHIEASPIVPKATEADIVELLIYLKQPGFIAKLSESARTRIQKLLGFVVAELRDGDPNYQEPLPDEEEELLSEQE